MTVTRRSEVVQQNRPGTLNRSTRCVVLAMSQGRRSNLENLKVLVLQPVLAAIVTSLGSLRGQVYPSLLKWAVPVSLSRCWQIIEDYLVHVCTRGRLGFGSLIF